MPSSAPEEYVPPQFSLCLKINYKRWRHDHQKDFKIFTNNGWPPKHAIKTRNKSRYRNDILQVLTKQYSHYHAFNLRNTHRLNAAPVWLCDTAAQHTHQRSVGYGLNARTIRRTSRDPDSKNLFYKQFLVPSFWYQRRGTRIASCIFKAE